VIMIEILLAANTERPTPNAERRTPNADGAGSEHR
jgi:hypothetical protein